MQAKRLLFGLAAAAAVLAAGGESALAGEPATRNLFEQFVWPGGGVIGILIIVIDVASIALIIEHFMTVRRAVILPVASRERIRKLFDEKQYRQVLDFTATDPSFLSAVVQAALAEASHGYSAMERAMEEATEERTTRLLRKIEVLNIIGNVAPMLGLLGTVLGMILAFNEIVSARGIPSPVQLADSIGIALVTTFWGLIVAVPALAVYSFMRNRIDGLSAETALAAQELIGMVCPQEG
ncbi:MAG: MotA/TolQ/ExbB proton channel family protein [Planctomycetes bacterium]|nr:MotA/TolQ/ExbB proton channel family protein [Planctomycetota bacterium]